MALSGQRQCNNIHIHIHISDLCVYTLCCFFLFLIVMIGLIDNTEVVGGCFV